MQGGFEAMYDQTVNDALHGTGRETFEAVNYLKQVNPSQYKAENGANYPRTAVRQRALANCAVDQSRRRFGSRLTDIGGWDTHVNEGNQQGQLSNLLRQFSSAIAALYTDLGARMDDVVVLTMSEFGRTAKRTATAARIMGMRMRCSWLAIAYAAERSTATGRD